MKLIEKTCPKCGANLGFKPGDKEVKCSYCNKEFIIEGNENNNGSGELAPENIKLVSKFGKFVVAIVIISFVVLLIIGVVTFNMFFKNFWTTNSDNWYEKSNNGIDDNEDLDDNILKSVNDISTEDQKKIEEKSLVILKKWNEKRSDISLNEYKNLGYYLVYDNFGTDIYNVYELNYNINGINHVIYAGVKYMHVNYNNKTVSVGNGSIFGSILIYDTYYSLWGYESVKDLYNDINLLNKNLVASDGLYKN